MKFHFPTQRTYICVYCDCICIFSLHLTYIRVSVCKFIWIFKKWATHILWRFQVIDFFSNAILDKWLNGPKEFHCNLFGVADFIFPMEEITRDKLQGSYGGIITGNASLLDGRRGKALYTNGIDQWVNFGNQRHSCLGNLTICCNGFVMAFWLKAHRYDDLRSDEYYLSSGGHTYLSVGVSVLMQNSKLAAQVRNESVTWTAMMIPVVINIWNHVALTWSGTDGGQLYFYLNGNVVAEDLRGTKMVNNRLKTLNDCVLGSVNHFDEFMKKIFAGEMSMDALQVWDALFDSKAMKDIYKNELI